MTHAHHNMWITVKDGLICHYNQITIVQEWDRSFTKEFCYLLCNFPIHVGARPSTFPDVRHLLYLITSPHCRWTSLLLTRSHQTPVKFTAVSVVKSEFVVLCCVFCWWSLSQSCWMSLRRQDSEVMWSNGVLIAARPLDLIFTFYPSNHVWPFEPKCIYNNSVQTGDWKMLYGVCSS